MAIGCFLLAAAGRPLPRLLDNDLARTFPSSRRGSQYVPLPLVVRGQGLRPDVA
ncbi:hypothetical protein Poly30_56230 [Planctomycetes bacterium Poly30]|uniref:Uncharacterized protein n=1 Tax=Saltatorellus ferox TaxID=2528018 RepID=A0A518F144_9BACT|nr:hypothetical protein Poly30_56230 [Planctomycetes bacterium Poly30]